MNKKQVISSLKQNQKDWRKQKTLYADGAIFAYGIAIDYIKEMYVKQ